jgi:hypothetical protein
MRKKKNSFFQHLQPDKERIEVVVQPEITAPDYCQITRDDLS